MKLELYLITVCVVWAYVCGRMCVGACVCVYLQVAFGDSSMIGVSTDPWSGEKVNKTTVMTNKK